MKVDIMRLIPLMKFSQNSQTPKNANIRNENINNLNSMSNSSRNSSTSSTQLIRNPQKFTMKIYFKQVFILLWKSFIIRKAHFISTFFEIIGPVMILVAFAYTYAKISSNKNHNVFAGYNNETKPAIKYSNPQHTFNFLHSPTNNHIFYTPQGTSSIQLVQSLYESYVIEGVSNETLLKQEMLHSLDSVSDFVNFFPFTLGINFEKIDTSKGQLKYKIFLPTKSLAKRQLNPFPDKINQAPRPYDLKSDFNLPISEVISRLNREFLMQFSQENSILLKMDLITLNRMPYPSYRNPKFTEFSVYDFLGLFFLISYTLVCPLIVKRITDEKSNKSKELLKMIGMSDFVFWSSHFFNYLFIIIIHSFIFIIILFYFDTPLLYYSSPLLCYFLFILFGIQMILFSMLITTVFSRPVLATIVTVILWLGSSVALFQALMPSLNQSNIENEAFSSRFITSFLPMGSLLWFISIIGTFENLDTGLTFSNINSSTILYGDFSILDTIIGVFCSYFVYIFLIWYLDNIWPFQYGVPKSPCFIFDPSYWFQKQKNIRRKDIPKKNEKFFEPDPIGLQSAIEIRNVSKVFGGMFSPKKTAVDGLWLNIYQHQLTVLLGHNGAGKSTTMNMITGIFKASYGEIYVNGYNVFSETNEARRNIGLCTQENILFNELTVFQHLKLYAILKNTKFSNVYQEVKRVLDLLQLTSKKDVLAINLSGGMKRKLQLGLAIIGKTDILILDEPTSGLDPEARRVIWDLLIAIRREKTILLTTHYMEEADVLGDRIAIMSRGKLCCCGTPFFLKEVFGTGYQLRIEKLPNFNSENFLKTLRKYIPTSVLKTEFETEIIYNFNQQSNNREQLSSNFPSLFKDIERSRKIYGINSFGLTYSTLEDVFLAVDSNPTLIQSDFDPTNEKNETSSLLLNINLTKPSELLTGFPLLYNQFLALLLKRFHYARRYWQMLILQLFIPTLIIVFAMKIDLIKSNDVTNIKPIEYNVENLYGIDTKAYYQGSKQLNKSYLMINSKYKSNVLSVAPSEVFEDFILEHNKELGTYIRKTIYGLQDVDNKAVYKVWFNAEQIHSIPLSLKAFFETILQSISPPHLKNDVFIDMSLVPLVVTMKSNESTNLSFMGYIMSWIVTCLLLLPIAFPFLASSYLLYPIKERVSKSKLIQLMTGLSPTVFWLSNFFFDLTYHIISISILYLIIYFFDSNKVFFDEQSTAEVLYLILFAFGVGTIPIAYFFSYFFNTSSSGFVFVLIIFLLFGLIANIFWSTVDFISNYLGYDLYEIHLAWANQLLPILRMVPIFSMLFGYQKLYKANSFVKICERFDDTILKTMCKDYSSSSSTSSLIKGCCPEICQKDDSCYDIGSFSFGRFGSGYEILFLFFSGLIYMSLIIIYENFKQHIHKYISWGRFFRKKQAQLNAHEGTTNMEDLDVIKERERIKNILIDPAQRYHSDLLIVYNLKKNFGNFIAVDNLSFGVRHSECFGLLGVNGAGKTTTFAMLTGDLFPTKGNAFINGDVSLMENLRSFQQNIGYCPQFDALLDNLSGEETLYLMASLRGVPRKKLSNEVSSLIKMIDLQEHSKKITSTYSGGNKRKLSIALSLIGNPPLLFLDEPTAGVDPSARRKVWKTLEFIKNNFNSAIILTSHSMEECEALCSRIGIMVSGRFRCLGSTQHLRTKYGQGYTIIIRLKREHELNTEYNKQVKAKLVEMIPSAKTNECHQCLMTFHVPDTNITWSEMFEKMAILDEELSFEDYIISDTTLESIFILFAQSQQNNQKQK